VTVLFADVKGSLDLAEQVDPEAWHQILNRFFEILTDGVHRFEGTVNQYTGDGIMALFGAPIAHEDHAQRACYAALYLRDELRRYADELRVEQGLNFSTRMGINSGEVIVGKIGDDLRMDYTAQGHTVGLASRMEQLAEPGKVLLTGNTERLVSDYFALRDLGSAQIKGASGGVSIFELEGMGRLRTRFDVARARGLTRFVGRYADLQTLDAALGRAIEGNGQVVGVVGEAGVGKSRLCYEFVQRCLARGIEVYQSHCPAHGKTTPLVPILELLRSYFGITDQDVASEARRKIAGTLLLLDEEFREILPLVFEFLGVPDPEQPTPRMEPETRQHQLFAFMRRMVQAPGSGERSVVFLDDLHWIDPASDAFLAQIVDAVPGTRLLVLLNFRPEYEADWVHKSYYQQIPLSPLGPEAVQELLADLLGSHPTVEGLKERICERTAGNPFFTEELVQTLVESGSLIGTRGAHRLARPVHELEIPTTVHAVLAARIDRLAERQKQVLHRAAVIGKRFGEPILERIAELPPGELAEAVSALKKAEFIYEQALYPVAEYAFKHPLTQDVALRSQLQEQRRRVHEAVARAIEETAGDKLEEQTSLIAHHWEEAGKQLEAARWHSRAARWIGWSDYAEAQAHWRRVRELVAELPTTPETKQLGARACRRSLNYAFRLGISEAEARQILEEGSRYAEDDLRERVLLIGAYGATAQNQGGIQQYLEAATEAARLAEQIDDLVLRAVTQCELAWADARAGNLREALRLSESGAELIGGDPQAGADEFGYSPFILFTMFRAWLLVWMGRLPEAPPYGELAVKLAREHGPLESVCWTLMCQSMRAYFRGDTELGPSVGREAARVAEQSGSGPARVGGYAALGTGRMLEEDWQGAIEALEASRALAHEARAWLEGEPECLALLAVCYLKRGEWERAIELAELGIDIARKIGIPFDLCRALLVRAQVLLEGGTNSVGQVEASLSEAERVVDETGARVWLPHISEARARLARLKKDEATSERELREAHQLFVEMGATGHAERLARELGL
jgi:adenylate cyclase